MIVAIQNLLIRGIVCISCTGNMVVESGCMYAVKMILVGLRRRVKTSIADVTENSSTVMFLQLLRGYTHHKNILWHYFRHIRTFCFCYHFVEEQVSRAVL